jgi:hypothetical protein
MSSLPLSDPESNGDPGYMNGTDSRPIPCQPRPAGRPKGFARLALIVCRLRQVIDEMNFAQRRMMARRLSYDGQLDRPDVPPETYAEFLLRASGPLRQEPSARQRSAGRAVR